MIVLCAANFMLFTISIINTSMEGLGIRDLYTSRNLFASYYIFIASILIATQTIAIFPEVSAQLPLEITFDKEEYTPFDQVTVNIIR